MPNTLQLKSVKETKLKTIEELRHHVYLLTKRLEHTETELVQARVSRDSWKARYVSMMTGPGNDKAPDGESQGLEGLNQGD